MTAPLDVGPPRDRDELERFAAIAGDALGFELRQPHGVWLDRYRPERFRLARRAGEVVGGLYLIDAGQFHGGRRVAMVGVSAVAIAPEARGDGAGTELVQAVVRELHRAGVPTATLYPATQPIYRRAGFEQAGDFVRLRVACAALPRGPSDLAIERVDPTVAAERAELVLLARAAAAAEPGGLDRDDFLWDRLLDPLAYRPHLFRVREDGRPTGFVSLQRVARPGPGLGRTDLHVRAIATTTAPALARLVTLMADHASLCEDVLLDGAPRNVILALTGEHRPTVDVATRWMVRVTEVGAALIARGYPVGLSADLELDLDDALLEQRGRHRLVIRDGVGHARPGGGGPALEISERGLAALYTGYFAAEELARLGLCHGDPATLARATSVFGGPAPWLGEVF